MGSRLSFSDLLSLKRFNEGKREEKQREDIAALKQENDSAKWLVSKHTELWGQTKDPAMRKHIQKTMESYYSALPPLQKAAVAPYLAYSPISEEKRRRTQFEELNPRPIPRSFSFEGEATTGEVNQLVAQEYAENYFAEEDWKLQRDAVTYGKPLGAKTNFLSLENGAVALRETGGRVRVLSEQDLGLKDLAKDLNTTVGKLKLNGGYHYTGRKVTKREGDEVVTYEVGEDIIGGREPYHMKELSRTPASKDTPEAYPGGLSTFLANVGDTGTDNPLAKTIQTTLDKEVKKKLPKGTTRDLLNSTFPGYSFRFEKLDPNEPLIELNSLFPNVNNFKVIPVRGVLTNFGTPEKPIGLWMDENNFIYDSQNRKRGHLDNIDSILTQLENE